MKRFSFLSRNQNGLSLVEAMIALGVSSIILLVITQAMKNFMGSENLLEMTARREAIRREITEKMSCDLTLAPYCAGGNCSGVMPTCPAATGPIPAVSKVTVKDSKGNDIISATGQRFGDWVIRAECIAGKGLRLEAAAMKVTAAVDSQTASDFRKDPVTNTLLNWDHINVTLMPKDVDDTDNTLSCVKAFQAPPGPGWCPAPGFRVSTSNLCPTNSILMGFSIARKELCCDYLANTAERATGYVNTLARYTPLASNRLQRSVINQLPTGEIGVGAPADANFRLNVDSSAYRGVYINGTENSHDARLLIDGNSSPPVGGDSNAGSIDFLNHTAPSWWHFTLRGASNSLQFHFRHSYDDNTTPVTQIHFNPNGTINTPPGGYSIYSDLRLKKDITKLDESILDKIENIKGVSFRLLSEPPGSKRHLGFIAQDVELQFPEAIGPLSNNYKTISYSAFAPVLVEAVKILDDRSKTAASLTQELIELEQELRDQGEAIKNLSEHASN